MEHIEGKKKKFIHYDKIRETINKGIYNMQLSELYKLKDVSREQVNISFNNLLEDIEGNFFETHLFNKYMYSNDVNKEDLNIIYNDIIRLSGSIKNYRYSYQTQEVKYKIDKITSYILMKSLDCSANYNKYIKNCIDIKHLISGDYKFNENELKEKYKIEMYNKIGNKILKFLKQYDERCYNKIKDYNKNVFLINNLISEIFFYITKEKQYSDLDLKYSKKLYKELSKQAQKEKYIEQENASEFDWNI